MTGKKIYISLVILLISTTVFSQKDTLLELNTNSSVRTFYNANLNNPNSPYLKKNQPNNKAVLTLPFIDDFSQNYIFPNQALWVDMDAYVNSNFPDNPVNFGAATLDGLDDTGYPYDFSNPTSYGIADHLSSQKIDLTSIIDSVFLSFYYQPQGNGNKPENKDSLRLEFFRSSDNTWVRMWGTPGVPNQAFRKVMIPVDVSFQTSNFQFRFMNWATLSGNVDHWNIDHVYLDENRNYADTALYDVSFITNHFNMLTEFTSMPWSHYKVDSISNMATSMNVTYKNNHSDSLLVFYKYQVTDNNGAGPTIETYPLTTSSKNVLAYSSLTEPQAVYNLPVNNFYFPPDTFKTKVFEIKNYFDINPFFDDFTNNDTVLSYQVFASHYAYDDGSAEVGYGVQGVGSKLAHEFNIKKSDTLTSFQIYFNPITNNLVSQTFRLKVWSSLSPEVEIYSQPATLFTSPIYSTTNQFLKYDLDVPLYLTAGTYYFGWEKITQEFLNVGWDVNTNNKTKVHFNAVGVWQTASFDGSLMLRPVFGSLPDPVVSVNDKEKNSSDFKIYPNPTSNIINFEINGNSINETYHISLIDIYGKTIIETESSLSNKINVSSISSGIYILRFTNNTTHNSLLKKVIISK